MLTPMDMGTVPRATDGGAHYVKKEFAEEPVIIKLGNNKYKYGCANCDVVPMATRHGMDAHICSVQCTQKSLSYVASATLVPSI